MRRAPPKRLSRASLAFLACALSACAVMTPSEAPPRTKAAPVAPAAARDAGIVGKSKREVLAALGPTATATFDSGYEVWVYHLDEGAATRGSKSEFVVLFDPSGVVTKTRIRPAPVARS